MTMDLDQKLLLQVIQRLRSAGQTLSLAESCTGGLLSSFVTAQAGISDIYYGGVVAYSYEAKKNIISVSAASLEKYGAVSINVAQEMAVGCLKVFNSSWAVSITGVAGPSGGTVDKPVGTVCFAVAGPQIVQSVQKHFSGERKDIQVQSANWALAFLLESLH